jgi:hypothetical protein
MTLLHQKQRHRDEQGRFIAEYSDYAIVYQLLEECFAESLGNVKRYTDDRIRMIEVVGKMTPRDLADKINVSTAAISQWSKPLLEKGVLNWCDETGAIFGNDLALEKAKRAGKAYLCVAGRNSLPSPFQLTGDPRWDKGGDLWAAYDLGLGDSPGDSDQASAMIENLSSEAVESFDAGDSKGTDGNGVKALSGKTNDEIKKMLEKFRETQSAGGSEDLVGDQLFQEFSNILSTEGIGAIN